MAGNQSEIRYLDVPTASFLRLVMGLFRTGEISPAVYASLEKHLVETKTLRAVLLLDPQGFYFRLSSDGTK